MSLSSHNDNKKKDILILDKGPRQGLEYTLAAEKLYPINFTNKIQNFLQACIIIEQVVIYLLMVQKLLNLKQNILKLRHIPCV